MEAASISGGASALLRFVGPDELARLRELAADPAARAAAFADACRINALSMIMEAGSGHVGTSFSAMDILAWLHLEVLGPDDVSFSSKGHDAPAVYAVLIGAGRLDFDLVHRLRRRDGLPGHPDVTVTPEVRTNTGSLGMGISKAKGFVRAARLRGLERRAYVLTGDGELQEGQFWESLGQAANERMHELTVVVDHNKIQSDTWVAAVSDLGDLEAKVAAFGWAVGRCDGNDPRALGTALADLGASAGDRPRLLIADTVKGAGVSFMEPPASERPADALYRFHSGAPAVEEYEAAIAELAARLGERVSALGAAPVELLERPVPARSVPEAPQRLIAAYSEALVARARDEPRLVALDADLVLDTGLIPFRAQFPERFVECGIAEQDMVSQAGALALEGLLPVVHSFGCFLTPRAAEQVYNNASERTKVVYVGSLVGLVPGGPGHSHQAVRDVALMGSVPGMAVIEPGWETEVGVALSWAVREATGPVYLRLVSVPWELGFEQPPAQALERGRGTVLREGDDAWLIAAGPVLLSSAWAAAEELAAAGVRSGVLAMPWLRDVDGQWLFDLVGTTPLLVLDNHVPAGGLGDAVLTALATRRPGPVHRAGVEGIPAGGANEEVLRAHGLDAASIAARVRSLLGAPA